MNQLINMSLMIHLRKIYANKLQVDSLPFDLSLIFFVICCLTLKKEKNILIYIILKAYLALCDT